VTNYSHFWTQLFWYIGTVGFIVYFIHRYEISETRAKLIRENNLEKKIKELQGLSEEEKSAIQYIFSTLQSSKEKWNYIFIFATSILALVMGFYLDFLR